MKKTDKRGDAGAPPASPPCSMHEVDPVYMGLASAPRLVADQWFNTPRALELDQLRGKVVVIEAFQMLCPGCVSHGLPQAQRIEATFSSEDVVVLGLHTVFEHHAAMTAESLKAFLHEYKIGFPVAVDRAQGLGMPVTMSAYAMQGTPTLVLIDAQGQLRKQWLGTVPDLVVGAEIMRLVLERQSAPGERHPI